MARKNKKLLSTLRALEDKQEPTLNQRELEEKSVPAPLNLAAVESEREPQESEASHESIAPLLTSSLIEEQLSELVTVPVATAESLHIVDITTATETEALEAETSVEAEALETETAVEAEAPAATPTEANQEPLDLSQEQAIAELEPASQPEAEPHSEEVTQPASATSEEYEEASAPELDSDETTIPTQPTHSSQGVAKQPENPGQQAETKAPAIATDSKATISKAELLKRPEAFAVIVFATFSSLWQAYVDLWAKPAPHRQRPSQRSAVEPQQPKS